MRSSTVLSFLAAASLLACATEEPPSTLRPTTSSKHNPTKSAPVNDTIAPPPGSAAPTAAATVGDETWEDGKQITVNTAVGAGKTVTIAPGATVTFAAGVSLIVQGTLKATTSATHAKLAGTGWGGVVIESGGALSADSLDITGASKGLWTQTGNADATYANGTITADTPLTMEPGSKLSLSHASATGTGPSALAGTFVASYLTYDKATAEGLYINDPAATVDISDSTLKGSGGGDYVVSNAAHSVKLAYTIISGSHCPEHFTKVDQFTLDHVSNNANTYGPMLYGSGAGPNTITDSNLRDMTYAYDVQSTNGKITITGSFVSGDVKVDDDNTTANTVSVVDSVGSAIAAAAPH